MKITDLVKKAHDMGDFYLYYTKFRGNGTTYLVGTTDFDNKYIQAMAGKHGSGLSTPITGAVSQRLEMMQKGAQASGKVLVFSWTNNKFRFIDSKDARRLVPLASELRNGRNKR